MIRFALAGNPNSGKTTLFNSLTGSTAHVGNWPGVTVDKREGVYKKGSEPVSIIDLPGIYSLSPYTSEEVISRNYILDEKPDLVINIVDATNIERNLYLTTQLLEMNVPVVVALNMIDMVRKNGDEIDVDLLAKNIGCPVVEISALKEENLDILMAKAIEYSKIKRESYSVLSKGKLSKLITLINKECEDKEVDNPLFHAIKLIENDELEVQNHRDLLPLVESFKNEFEDEVFGDDFEAIVADERYRYITTHYMTAVKKAGEKNALTFSDKVDKVLTNKWAGIPIFILILFLIFHFTFTEDLFFLNALGAFGENGLVSFKGNEMWQGVFADGGIKSIGAIGLTLVEIVTDWLSGLVETGLTQLGATEATISFVVNGALAGVFGVLTFIPQILVLFLFFSILEDSGYMARVAFILDKIFRRFGLSGRAFMPMIMGFGCSVPAMINTRTLADENERVATVRVIPFFSCGAKLPILTAIIGAIAEALGASYVELITLAMYLIGMITAIVSVIVMRKTTMKGEVPPFIMELPSYHMPQFKSLMIHLWDKFKHFIQKAFTIILASTIVIWFLSSFGWDWLYVGDAIDQSILASLGKLIQPIFTPLGFGSNLTSWGWVFAVAAITGLIAKENVISTFFTLATCIIAALNTLDPAMVEQLIELGLIEATEDGVKEVQALVIVSGITWPALISFITFNMTTIPCFAAVASAKGELTKKKFDLTLVFWLVVSYIVSCFVYLVLLPFENPSLWWTELLALLIILLVIAGVILYNFVEKRKLSK